MFTELSFVGIKVKRIFCCLVVLFLLLLLLLLNSIVFHPPPPPHFYIPPPPPPLPPQWYDCKRIKSGYFINNSIAVVVVVVVEEGYINDIETSQLMRFPRKNPNQKIPTILQQQSLFVLLPYIHDDYKAILEIKLGYWLPGITIGACGARQSVRMLLFMILLL